MNVPAFQVGFDWETVWRGMVVVEIFDFKLVEMGDLEDLGQITNASALDLELHGAGGGV